MTLNLRTRLNFQELLIVIIEDINCVSFMTKAYEQDMLNEQLGS